MARNIADIMAGSPPTSERTPEEARQEILRRMSELGKISLAAEMSVAEKSNLQ